ncbi:ABC-2 transporter permease [Acidobacteriota bacterium]
MWRVLKNNADTFIFISTGIFLAIFILRMITGPELSPYFVSFSAILLYIAILGPISTREQYEEKHKGYAVLAPLPLTILEIVAAKYILVFCSLALTAGFTIVLLLTTQANPSEMSLGISFILFNGAAALLLGGLMYIGIFGLGYTKFMFVVLSITVALGLVPFVIMRFVGMDRLMESMIQFLESANWLVFIPITILLYIALMFLTATLRKRKPA